MATTDNKIKSIHQIFVYKRRILILHVFKFYFRSTIIIINIKKFKKIGGLQVAPNHVNTRFSFWETNCVTANYLKTLLTGLVLFMNNNIKYIKFYSTTMIFPDKISF